MDYVAVYPKNDGFRPLQPRMQNKGPFIDFTILSTAELFTVISVMSEMVCPPGLSSQFEHKMGSPALGFSSCDSQGMTESRRVFFWEKGEKNKS